MAIRAGLLLQDTPRIYGAERATLTLARGLLEAGEVAPHFILIKEERLKIQTTDLQAYLEENAFPFSSLPIRSRFSREFMVRLSGCLKQQEIDLLHAVGPKAVLYGGVASGWGRICPVVTTVHGWLNRWDLKERFYTWLEIRALKKYQRVITLSRYYQDLMGAKGVPRDKVVYIPTGFDEDGLVSRKTRHRDPGVVTLGMLGRFSSEKQHRFILQVFERLVKKHPGLRLILAGEGPLRTEVMGFVEDLGLTSEVTVPGYLSVNDFMQSIDVYLIPSKIENLPFSVLEAMNWRRPVVASDVGGLPDLVEEGTTGYLLSPDNLQAWYHCVESLVGDAERMTRLGESGREKLEREFMLKRSVEDHQELMKELVAG